MLLWIVLAAFLMQFAAGERYVKIGNRNTFPIWIQTQPNTGQPHIRNGRIVKLNPNDCTKYYISDAGWSGRFWPKVGCNRNGENCEFGQSIEPCPACGCQPPAETKLEFFFPPVNSSIASYYDISLIDGYSLSAEITPYQNVSDFVFCF